METLNQFFKQFITLSFWTRLFRWGPIKATAYQALEELQKLKATQMTYDKHLSSLSNTIEKKEQENRHLKSSLEELKNHNQELKTDVRLISQRSEERASLISELKAKNQKLEADMESLRKNVQAEMDKFMHSREALDQDKQRLENERVAEVEARHERLKLTWSVHEAQVKKDIQQLTNKHIIEYCTEVPFRGSPDNVIRICGEMIIFDAKSPSGDDLTNFPKYIKDQADKAKKYANKEDVRKDIYLVVPSATVEVIKQWTYELGEYNVYVITRDALEPVILSLKRLEDYHFLEQLSPEERDAIARLIGKFAHSTKRKIQIDQFFADEFFHLLKRAEKDLPSDFKEKVIAFEKQEKLNPPMEKRAKMISTTELEEEHLKTNAEAGLRQIAIPKNKLDAKDLI